MWVHWHRRDLRAADNRALAAAAASDEVLPVFVLDPAVLEFAGAPRTAFLLDSLADLRAWYRDRDSDLIVVRGEPATTLPEVATAHGADRAVWNRDYSPLAHQRDDAVRDSLEEAGLGVETFEDALLHPPGSITTAKGDPYSVYSYFWEKWRDREKPPPAPAPEADRLASVEGDPLPTAEDLGVDIPGGTVPDGGSTAARERLEAFCAGPIYDYEADRDYPAREATSRLSPHLKFGTVGVRDVSAAVGRAMEDAPDAPAAASCEEFAGQLAWREFYAHVLEAHPRVVTEDYRRYERPIEWAEDPEGVAAWRAGETGFPLVDAGMRQLAAEAFMHNRVRMVVASFLTKDLLVDWREGYSWFRERLVDHDTANDSGGWQWAAGTGTDAQPYFRVFNPMRQAERFDPDAEYIRQYVPELAEAPAEAIHAWDALEPAERDSHAPAYPAPIVDHAARRERAIATFEAARGEGG